MNKGLFIYSRNKETLDYVSCFPYTSFVLYPLPACFTTEQITGEASLFVL